MRFLIAIAAFLLSSRASACELSLVAPAHSALKNSVQARATLADDALTVRFVVATPSLNAKRILGKGKYPYDFDVVEVFLTFSESGFPYFEFEVSPFNQTLQVRIVSAREHHEGVDLGLISTAEIVHGGWTAELKIPLTALGWSGDGAKIRGNFYSTLGKAPRSYWSTNLPKASRPNFHQPQYFKPLLTCS
jgi:Carbohydrate-binding family 9